MGVAEMACEVAGKGSGPLALVAEGDVALRRAEESALAELGLVLLKLQPGLELAACVREHHPQVVLLDIDLAHVDTLGCVRTIKQDVRTRSVGVILTCGASTSRERLSTYAQAGADSILLKPTQRESLLQHVKQVLQRQAQKALKAAEPASASPGCGSGEHKPAARIVPENNSLLQRQVHCPFHTPATPFAMYTLRTGHVVSDMNFFGIPQYLSAGPNCQFVNYHLLAVLVCPDCLFASMDGGYFVHPDDAKANPYAFGAKVTQMVQEGAAQRRALAGNLPPEFFTHQRTIEEALVSYQLALHSSQTLFQACDHEFAMELLRQANHHLRLAHLQELMKKPVTAEADHYAAALPLLTQAFAAIEGPAVFKVIHQLVATAIYLGEEQTAARYLDRLRTMQRELHLSGEDKGMLERSLNHCQTAWEDRRSRRREGGTPAAEAARQAD